jgi:hypothetical protein
MIRSWIRRALESFLVPYARESWRWKRSALRLRSVAREALDESRAVAERNEALLQELEHEKAQLRLCKAQLRKQDADARDMTRCLTRALDRLEYLRQCGVDRWLRDRQANWFKSMGSDVATTYEK